MKKFTKLALASSVALSANAMAMQAMDDSALSSTTGQDGINIGIGISKIEIDKLFIHDNDGLNGTAANAGAIVIKGNNAGTAATNPVFSKGVVITAPLDYTDPTSPTLDETRVYATHNLLDLRIDSDAGTAAGGGAFLNIAADVAGLDIYIGEIGVTASNAKPAATADDIRRGGKLDGNDKNYNAILSGLTLKTGKMNANIQVGAAPQGAMIKLDTEMLGGLTIENLGILDNSTAIASVPEDLNATPPVAGVEGRAAGEIYIGKIKIADAESKNLKIDAKVSVYGATSTNDGYLQVVSTSGAHDMYIETINLGSRTGGSIGDVEIQGMQTYYGPADNLSKGSVITISGR